MSPTVIPTSTLRRVLNPVYLNFNSRLRRHISSVTGIDSRFTLSAVEGPLIPPLVEDTLPSYFTHSILAHHAHRPALICRSEPPSAHGKLSATSVGMDAKGCLVWDFSELDLHVRALARGLIGMGIRKGDRVGVVMGNNSAYACLQWACASIGAILVTLNPAYRPHELIATLSLVGVSALFLVPRLRSSSYLTALSSVMPSLVSSPPNAIDVPQIPTLRHLVIVDNTSSAAETPFVSEQFKKYLGLLKCAVDFREMLVWREDGEEERVRRDIARTLDPYEVMNLQFTSGTTGAPKAVSLTHHNLLNNALSIGRCMRLTAKDIVCNVPPLFHCFGLVLGNLAAWAHGASIVYPAESFDGCATVDAVLTEKCTALHGVPTHFLGVLGEVERRRAEGHKMDFSSLRTGIAAGSPIPIELMRQLIKQLNLSELTNAYGMTETSPVSFQTVPHDPITKRVETVGRVQPHVKAKLIDPKGNIVPIGTPGEICVSGYLIQKGYWADEERTKEVMIPEGDEGTVWMHTGDEGIMDEEGYLRVIARIKDIIIRGGENLFPVQIENVLTSHPEVLEAAAVAVPDAKYGEVVGAWISTHKPQHHGGKGPGPRLSRKDMCEWVAQGMNPQNTPEWVWFLGEDGVPDELPKTASGKVMKNVLRQWSRELSEKGTGNVRLG